MSTETEMSYITATFVQSGKHPAFGREGTSLVLMGFAMGYAAGRGKSYVVALTGPANAKHVSLAFRDTNSGAPIRRVAAEVLEASGLSDYFATVFGEDNPKPLRDVVKGARTLTLVK